MKTSYEEIFEFQQVAVIYLNEVKVGEETLLSEALYEVLDQVKEHAKVFNKAKMKLQRKYALTEPKTGFLLKHENGDFKYTPEKEESLFDDVDQLREEKDAIWIEPERIKEFPADLHRTFKKAFNGFVIVEKQEVTE